MDKGEKVDKIISSFHEVNKFFYKQMWHLANELGVTVSQLQILKLISQEPNLGLHELTKKMKINKSAVSSTVDRLVKACINKRCIIYKYYFFVRTFWNSANIGSVFPIVYIIRCHLHKAVQQKKQRLFLLKSASYLEWRRTIYGFHSAILTKKEGIIWFTRLKDRGG